MPDESTVDPAIGGKGCTRVAAQVSADSTIADLARAQHGVVSRRQLLAAGIGARAIEVRLERRTLHAVHRGVYAVGHLVVSPRGKWMAATLAGGPRAVLSHRSAGQLWRIVPQSGGVPEITANTRWRKRHGLVVHRSTLLGDESTRLDGIPVTGPARTQLDLAVILPRERLERAMNQAEVRRLTDLLSIPDLLARHPGRRGNAVLRAILRDSERARGVTVNDFEDRFAALIRRHGLPPPRFNADIAVAGRFFRADAIWTEARLIVELDGGAAHGTEMAFENDRERDRLLLVEGWSTTRITWRQLRDKPDDVAADLRRLLDTSSID